MTPADSDPGAPGRDYHLSQLQGARGRVASTSSARSRPRWSGPVLLFSGGKDSIVMLRLAEKAFCAGARSRSR